MKKKANTLPANADAASGTVPTRPIITLSITPMSIWLTWPIVMGIARWSVDRASLRTACIEDCYCGPPGDVQ